MVWFQKQFALQAKSRGSYLITDQVVSALPEIKDYKVGILNLFLQHTSAALSLNENCRITMDLEKLWLSLIMPTGDSDVREDMSDALDRIAPEAGPKGEALYRHESVSRYSKMLQISLTLLSTVLRVLMICLYALICIFENFR